MLLIVTAMATDRSYQSRHDHASDNIHGQLPTWSFPVDRWYFDPQYSSNLSAGVNSAITSGIIVGLVSQLWIRKYHPGWYKKYNYILGGAFDGGAQVMIFILSFAVFGASGAQRPFPQVSLFILYSDNYWFLSRVCAVGGQSGCRKCRLL